MMVDREDEDLQMALRMSLHESPPEPKRSRPVMPDESEMAMERRRQRELRAAAAERRISLMNANAVTSTSMVVEEKEQEQENFGNEESRNFNAECDAGTRKKVEEKGGIQEKVEWKRVGRDEDFGEELSAELANQLFTVMFGSDISTGILARWSNQGIRFSSDPSTCMGLVQHEGGPCGVLAAIQAFVMKYLLFFPELLCGTTSTSSQQYLDLKRLFRTPEEELCKSIHISENIMQRALVLSMVEILFSCGRRKRAVVATLDIPGVHFEHGSEDTQKDEMLSGALEGFTMASASDLQRVLRITTYTSEASAFQRLMADLPVFKSRFGATLFLISALLSRGLDYIQADRDDPSLPLVTAPFGHASQEIVNLLLCGHAAPNVFDDNMDLGGGMSLKGIPGNVEVGFLTLLESLNFCKVGQYLKCPRLPIWVVGSESHYTVLFALETSVQDENELETRESKIRNAFNNQDQSGGGGFITVDAFHQVLRETDIELPPEKLDGLTGGGYIVWSDFWQVLLELDRKAGGMKDSNGLGKKQFDIYHFNGIAKSVTNGSQVTGSEMPIQRPRLCKLIVSVPPRWTQEEFMADVVSTSSHEPERKDGTSGEVDQIPKPSRHAPLVDCIRTRWPRAVCDWIGDPPSIV